MSNYQSSRNNTFDGLHPQFVNAMRTLFEIMDERKCGYVKFTDIESRWQDGESLALPRGVLESLRKVTPPNGLLSFERFCAGLKICLLRHKGVTQNSFNHSLQTSSSGSNLSGSQPGGGHNQHHEPLTRSKSAVLRPASVPLPDREGAGARKSPTLECNPTHGGGTQVPGLMQRSGSASENNWVNNHVNTATVRPNNAAVNRTVSMPQLQGENRGQISAGYQENQLARGHPMGMRECRSESKIPTVPDQTNQWNNPRATANVRPNRRLGIRAALENWKNGMLNNETNDQQMFQARAEKVRIPPMTQNNQTQHPPLQRRPPPPLQNSHLPHTHPPNPPQEAEQYNRPIMRSKSSTTIVGQQVNNNSPEEENGNRLVHETGPAARRAFNRRREPRRHTLANGIDYSMLKRMKQMEQERDILLQGYQTIERGREWFLARLTHLQDKMHFWGKNNYHSEYSSDVHQERLNLEMTRILEVNQNINALIESTEKGHMHMNLAVRSPINKMQYNSTQTHIHRLKEQNRMLTEEVGKKSEYITQLEKEKSALVRELFQSRSQQQRHHVDDTTFM